MKKILLAAVAVVALGSLVTAPVYAANNGKSESGSSGDNGKVGENGKAGDPHGNNHTGNQGNGNDKKNGNAGGTK